jgi:hydrogenase nickel incorporation protein HypA/HybF
MHELSLCQAIAATVDRHAAGARARAVVVRIGYLRQVVPESLQFNWELVTASTSLAGTSLEIEHVPAVVCCRTCGAATSLELPVLVCGTCGSFEVQLISGEEFLVKSLELEAGDDEEGTDEQHDRAKPGGRAVGAAAAGAAAAAAAKVAAPAVAPAGSEGR